MTDITRTTPIALPEPRVSINIRPGTLEDLGWIDALQKRHSKQLGFMNRPTLEGKVKLGHVLIAEAIGVASGQWSVAREDRSQVISSHSPLTTDHSSSHSPLTTSHSVPAGYLIGNDRYQHRDELGVIFQMCVAPEFRRSLVAGNLLKAQFERSAYGCKLYCCWCAQDIEANRFWESMGFVPIAFRAGSEKRARVHIFWQKRIREGDTTTPWWFPSMTSGGMMDAARIALPIPPGMTWRDELPRLVPTEQKALNHEDTKSAKGDTKKTNKKNDFVEPSCASRLGGEKKLAVVPGKLWFGAPKPVVEEKPKRPQPVKPKRVKTVDPTLATRARELRDRWCERASEVGMLPSGKYDTVRQIEGRTNESMPTLKQLAA
jgi:hypothetical protein